MIIHIIRARVFIKYMKSPFISTFFIIATMTSSLCIVSSSLHAQTLTIESISSDFTSDLTAFSAAEASQSFSGELIGYQLTGGTSPIQVGTLNGGELDITLASSTIINLSNTNTTTTGTVTGISASSVEMGDVAGTLNVSSQGNAVGLELLNTSIESLTGTISSQSTAGSSTGILLNGTNTISAIDNFTIVASTSGSSSRATGMSFESANNGSSDTSVNANITVTAINGQASLMLANINPDNIDINTGARSPFGLISGTYTMTSNTTYLDTISYSAGYLLGVKGAGTQFALGFKNSYVDGTSGSLQNSEGLAVDWNNITLNVNRGLGLAAGYVAVGYDYGSSEFSLGEGGAISTTSGLGAAVGVWINGSSVGDMNGTITASVTGSSTGASTAAGLLTTGSAAANTLPALQSLSNSSIGNIGGSISATIGTNGQAVALQIGSTETVKASGNIFASAGTDTVDYITTIGDISGQLLAQSTSDTNVQVTGIEDIADRTLSFINGASVTALINTTSDGGALTSTAYGTAINNTTAGISVSASSSSTSGGTQVQFIGNLEAGTNSINFESGNFDVKASSLNASTSITFGSGDNTSTDITTTYQTSTVTISELVSSSGDLNTIAKSTDMSTSTLDFYLNSASDNSSLIVGENIALNISDMTQVNVYLTGDVSEYLVGLPIALLDARQATGFTWDDLTITYTIYLNGVVYTPTSSFYIEHSIEGIFLVPEPSSATLCLISLSILLRRRRRK